MQSLGTLAIRKLPSGLIVQTRLEVKSLLWNGAGTAMCMYNSSLWLLLAVMELPRSSATWEERR